MKYVYWIIGILLILGIIYLVMNRPEGMENVGGASTGADIIPVSHASFALRIGTDTIYVDPVGGAEMYAALPDATLVLVTDIHGDHFSTSTLEAVAQHAPLVVPQAVFDLLTPEQASRATILSNGESLDRNGLSILAVPMYNLPGEENADRHPEGRGNGYIVTVNERRIYIAGDTAGTPEMRALTDIDIALVPMNLPYTMGVEEAADAVLSFKPAMVIPYHYRTPDGYSDVNRFKELVNEGDPSIEVVQLEWYPDQNKG